MCFGRSGSVDGLRGRHELKVPGQNAVHAFESHPQKFLPAPFVLLRRQPEAHVM